MPVNLEDSQLPSATLIQYPFPHHRNGLVYSTVGGTNGVRLRADKRADSSTKMTFRFIKLSDLCKINDCELLVVICSCLIFPLTRYCSLVSHVNISFHQVGSPKCKNRSNSTFHVTKWTDTNSPVIFLRDRSSCFSWDVTYYLCTGNMISFLGNLWNNCGALICFQEELFKRNGTFKPG